MKVAKRVETFHGLRKESSVTSLPSPYAIIDKLICVKQCCLYFRSNSDMSYKKEPVLPKNRIRKRYRTGDKETISSSLSLEINAGRICSFFERLNDVIFSMRLGVTGRGTSFASKNAALRALAKKGENRMTNSVHSRLSPFETKHIASLVNVQEKNVLDNKIIRELKQWGREKLLNREEILDEYLTYRHVLNDYINILQESKPEAESGEGNIEKVANYVGLTTAHSNARRR
ncbi:hypothetical protein POVCU2_0051560 [Plasmodium ovale curtisi]|uniref:Uncharacterized protein n=1 Tax=Plasmodium ovale curtisi TaxID=864141 RepID=A0A1A8WB58_PLAOA|nr:hypothetical protein POVCU2_0051560 [Plasmodium ovale curtisi]